MNTVLEHSYTNTDLANEVFQPVTDLYESISEWFEIRVSEMPGEDYVFAPMQTCDQITNFVTLQSFLENIQTVLRSDRERIILIGFSYEADGSVELDRYEVEWNEAFVINSRRKSLNGTAQYDFIKMLLEHSEKLIADD